MVDELILVIDDEPGIVRLCERLLKKAGYGVVSFTKPSEALRVLERDEIDLLIVDIRMPEMGGFDLISLFQNQQPGAAILIMTGFGTMEMAIQALRQGVDGLILKPFERGDELIQAVKYALEVSQRRRDVARIQTLRPLFDVTETLLAETRPDRLLKLIINAVSGHLHCEHAGFYQYSPDDRSLHLVFGKGKTFPDELSDAQGGILGRADASGTSYWINAKGPGDEAVQNQLRSHDLASVMCVPLSRFTIRGVLYAGRAEGELPFREADWEMFLLLTRQAAIAMENARLYAELRNTVRQMDESQQALVRSEKMAAVGRMTASIAHEINNPLQAVQNCLHLALQEGLTDEKRQEYLLMAKQELDRLMQTVQNMLDLFRPNGLDPQQVDIAELLEHVIGLFSAQLEARGIRVTTGISSKIPRVLVISNQIQQVFINLILNAYDAMPKGGELRITARYTKETVEIIFQDTGRGVAPEHRSRIFEPFVSTKERGTGLGLSVSYGIISAHGGSLDLVPGRGLGACFRVILPAKKEKSA